jgi:hypothetical protein
MHTSIIISNVKIEVCYDCFILIVFVDIWTNKAFGSLKCNVARLRRESIRWRYGSLLRPGPLRDVVLSNNNPFTPDCAHPWVLSHYGTTKQISAISDLTPLPSQWIFHIVFLTIRWTKHYLIYYGRAWIPCWPSPCLARQGVETVDAFGSFAHCLIACESKNFARYLGWAKFSSPVLARLALLGEVTQAS